MHHIHISKLWTDVLLLFMNLHSRILQECINNTDFKMFSFFRQKVQAAIFSRYRKAVSSCFVIKQCRRNSCSI